MSRLRANKALPAASPPRWQQALFISLNRSSDVPMCKAVVHDVPRPPRASRRVAVGRRRATVCVRASEVRAVHGDTTEHGLRGRRACCHLTCVFVRMREVVYKEAKKDRKW